MCKKFSMRGLSFLHAFRGIGMEQRAFIGYANDATEYSQWLTTISEQWDLKPSQTRKLFKLYCANSIYDWRTNARRTVLGCLDWLTLIKENM